MIVQVFIFPLALVACHSFRAATDKSKSPMEETLAEAPADDDGAARQGTVAEPAEPPEPPTPCAAIYERFEERRKLATGVCVEDAGCLCHDVLPFDQSWDVTDIESARALQALVDESRAMQCPVVFVDLAGGSSCEPRCVDGRCRMAPDPSYLP